MALLLAPSALACYVSNRIYTGLAQRHRRLQTHCEFVSSVVRSTDLAEITVLGARIARTCCGPTTPSCCCGRWPRTSRPGASASASGRRRPTCRCRPHRRRAALMPDGTLPGEHRAPPGVAEADDRGRAGRPITGTDRSVVGALVVTQARRKAASGFGNSHTSLLGRWPCRRRSPSRTACCSGGSSRRPTTGPTRRCTTRSPGCPTGSMLSELLDTALEEPTSRGRPG